MDIQNEDDEQLEENSINVDDYINEAAFESERCGICMDIVVDRGVLDCCHHWYCFACIDNWATITNLCPLCNKEFQLITCMPVYDTLGNLDINEHAIAREDSWCIQEKNNTLSFPSYYINEDAVKCLDGDGCKMRSQNSAVEQDLYMDTSIACDSCDIWYHAFCVEFDPQNQPQNSWLCPRCINDQVPKEYNLKTTDHATSVDCSFSGRVSVSIADSGETAIVVSMVDLHESTEAVTDCHPVTNVERQEPGNDLSGSSTGLVVPLGQDCDPQNLLDSTVFTPEGKLMVSTSTQDTQINVLTNNTSEKSFGVSMLEDSLFSSQEATQTDTIVKSETEGQEAFKPCTSYECNPSILDATSTSSNMANHEITHDHCLELSHSLDSDVKVAETKKIDVRNASQDKLSFSSGIADTNNTGLGSVDELEELTKGKRKCRSPVRDGDVDMDAQIAERGGGSCRSLEKVYFKRARLRESSEQEHQVNVPIADDPQGCLHSKNSHIEGHSLSKFAEKNVCEDIMSIVQEAQNKSSGELDKTAGPQKSRLRVKKIMRRVGDDVESTILVQKLQNEIRDAVQKNPSNDLDKLDVVDRKLLAAFRAAIVKPRNEVEKKNDRSHVPMNNTVLRRGKTRESLTKKIYGTANGRRKTAWARDRQIEFWKHRCLSKKPEKVEALKSVLEILKTLHSSPCDSGSKKEPEVTADKSILSRVYLADTSVFPRKENLKPLSSLAEVSVRGDLDENRKHRCSDTTSDKNLVVTPKVDMSVSEQVLVCSNVQSKKEMDCLTSREVFPFMKDHEKRSKVGDVSLLSAPKGVSCGSQQSDNAPGHSLKTADKRKWAIEILARKNASNNTEKRIGKEDDNSMLKSAHPLLAQLPVDMRPVLLAVSGHNKVPLSTRQAQLYRLTEFYLQKADLPVVCRCAAAELAVADAINIEKAISDKSISKSVYVNLCSQHIGSCKQQKVEKLAPFCENFTIDDSKEDNKVESEPVEPYNSTEEALKLTGLLSDSPPESPAQPSKCAEDEDSEKMHTQKGCCDNEPVETCKSAEEALKLTGLLSDSPPESPAQPSKCAEDEDSEKMHTQKGCCDNVLDTHCNSEMDICGDFGHNLNEVCTISSSLSIVQNVSNSGSDDSDLKSKVVLSTHNFGRSDDDMNKKKESIMLIDVNEERPNSLNESTELEMQTEPVSVCRKDETQLQFNTDKPEPGSLDKECKELYGPDKKFLAESILGKRPDAATRIVGHMEYENNNLNNKHSVYSDSERKILISKPEVECSAEEKDAVSQTATLTESNLALEKENMNTNKPPTAAINVFQKVEAYIKEHIRPLCKSGVITVEQYRWTVGKTTEKVMKHHCKAKNANFLIKEGDKVKKLAEQYVEAALQKEWKRAPN